MQNGILNMVNECFEYTNINKELTLFNSMNYILKELTKYININAGFICEKKKKDLKDYLKYHGLYNMKNYDFNNKFILDKFITEIPFISNYELLEITEPIKKENIVIKHNITDEINSLYIIPLFTKTDIIGYIGLFTNNDIIIDTKELIPFTNFIANLITNINNLKDIDSKKLSFIANISHEIRTPLNGIITMVDIIGKTELTNEQLKYLQIMKNCNVQLLDIVNDILDYSKIITNGIKLKLSPVSLHAICDMVYSQLKYKANEKNLKLVLTVSPEVPNMIMGNSTRIKQVLINIISNSIKFTKHGEINISVELFKLIEDNECIIYFKVNDTGIGIPADKLNKVFDSFHQVENDYLSDICGVGLGLPITKHIIEGFNGNIWLESSLNVGTTVHITMKFKLFSNIINKDKLKLFYNNKNVLLIDNDLTERLLLFEFLIDLNIKPITTNSINEAAIYLSRTLYDFEFIILNLNDLTSDDLLLLNRIKNHHVRIIIVDIDKNDDNNINYDYKLIRPIDNTKLLYLLNIIFINNQYKNNHNEIILNGSNKKINELNLLSGGGLSIINGEKNLNIIVAEDNISNQEVILNVLNYIGYKNIKIVNDGMELLNSMLENNYDIALIDLKMPIMDGITAVKKFKELSDKKTILIALTASLSDDIKTKCFEAKFNGFITKPIDIDSIEKVIKLVINKKENI